MATFNAAHPSRAVSAASPCHILLLLAGTVILLAVALAFAGAVRGLQGK